MAYQLYVPLWWIRYNRLEPADFGINIHGRQDLRRTALAIVIIFPIYALLYFGMQWYLAWRNSFVIHIHPDLQIGLAWMFFTELALVAIPEEVFYRGFLQTRLLRMWPFWKAALVANLFFALAHFVGDYNIARLLPFFPGLVFSYLAYRSGSVMGASIFHALCNCFSQVLYKSVIWAK